MRYPGQNQEKASFILPHPFKTASPSKPAQRETKEILRP
jgi:hypothetical protein